MLSVNDCFAKVEKDCLNYILSQESRSEKFKNKTKMIKSYLIPVCFWIAKKSNKKKPVVIGLSGGQGTGKTTITSLIKLILQKYFKLKVFRISIDDFYKTRKQRKNLSKNIHPLLMTRGVPGTHDTKIIINFFKKIKSKKFKFMKIPKFDKSIDDRCKNSQWFKIYSKPDVIIFEGWCVGAKPQNRNQLKKPANNLEKFQDKNLIWRKFVNNNLKTSYKKLFKNINYFLYLKVSKFTQLQSWRIKQEKKLRIKLNNRKGLKIMSNNDIINFMQTYQRITEHMFRETPKNSSIIFNLNSKHQIKSIKFKK